MVYKKHTPVCSTFELPHALTSQPLPENSLQNILSPTMAALVGKLLLGATVIAKASAVIITLFDAQMVGQPVCQSDVLLVCSDIAAGQCCYIPGSDFGNALFSGLLEYAVGVVYQDNSEGGGGCAGTATDTGYGFV